MKLKDPCYNSEGIFFQTPKKKIIFHRYMSLGKIIKGLGEILDEIKNIDVDPYRKNTKFDFYNKYTINHFIRGSLLTI